jgi:hypothetical protein
MIGFIVHCFTITVDYNSSHIELLLDNESLTVFLLVLGLVSNRSNSKSKSHCD